MGEFFKTPEEFQKIFTNLIEKIFKEKEINSTIKSFNKVLTFSFTDLDLILSVNPNNKENLVIKRDDDSIGDVRLWMNSDVTHKLLLGKQNPISAIMAREIRVVGPFQAMTNVANIFQIANRAYKNILIENGLENLI